MAVSDQTPVNSSTGNGVTTVFPYTFKIIAAADLEVSVDGVVKTLNSDYTVSGAGVAAGGNVTFTTAPASGTTVVRRRDMAYVRTTDYQYQGELPNDVLNLDQDAPVLMIQQLAEEVGRSLKVPPGEDALGHLPSAEDRAGSYLAFDVDSNPVAASGTGADAGLRADLAGTTGATLIGFRHGAGVTGDVLRTARAKMREIVSAEDFGAIGDGTSHPLSETYASLADAQVDYPHATSLTDETDWAAIQAMINHLESIGGGDGHLAVAHYIVNRTLVVDDHGPMLIGKGCGIFFGTNEAQLLASPTTTIEFTGAPDELLHFTSVTGDFLKSGGGIKNVFLHCGTGVGIATYGIRITSWRHLRVEDVLIFNATAWAVKTECFPGVLASPVAGYDVQHCHFFNVFSSVDTSNSTGGGLLLSGGQGNGNTVQGNTAFNIFVNTRWHSNDTVNAVRLEATDNNSFYGLRANGGGVESPITVAALLLGCSQDDESGAGHACRYNNFYGVEAAGGVIARASTDGGQSSYHNAIYGYNISNGGDVPKWETGAGGSADGQLYVYGHRIYGPGEWHLPADGVIVYDERSAATTGRTGTATYTKGYLEEQGLLDPTAIKIVGSTAAGTCVYATAVGSYTRLNRLVYVQITVEWSGHTGTGDLLIEGLPFAALNASNRPAVLSVAASNVTFSGRPVVITQANSKQMKLMSVSTGAALVEVPMDAAGTLFISGMYQCEQ